MDTDIKKLYMKADEVARQFIQNTTEADLDKESILPSWRVSTLVNHLVNENYWTAPILEGQTIDEVGDKYDGNVLGNDFQKAWDDSSTEAKIGVEKLDDISKMVHLSYADVPAKEYLIQRIQDMTIHGWDLAKSTGQEDTLPEDLLQFIWDEASPREPELRASGLFGELIETPEDSDLQTKVLALLGRTR